MQMSYNRKSMNFSMLLPLIFCSKKLSEYLKLIKNVKAKRREKGEKEERGGREGVK